MIHMKKQLLFLFAEKFGGEELPRAFFAGGRVNLIGEHTDYNGGHVFPCALTMGTLCLLRPRRDRQLRFFSANFSELGILYGSLDELAYAKKAGWSNYCTGMLWTMAQRGIFIPLGFDMLVWGNIPSGAGLSSSASLEMAMGEALRQVYGLEFSNTTMALLGQQMENDFKKDEKHLEEIKKRIESCKNKREENEKFLEKYKNVNICIEECKNNRQKLLEKLQQYEEIKTQRIKTEKLKEECMAAKKESDEKQQRYREALLSYEELYQMFLNEQAGILALGLEKGMPCPVCGSKEHPRICSLSNQAPSQAEVEEAKRKREENERIRDEAGTKFQEISSRYQAAAEVYKTLLGKVEDIDREKSDKEELKELERKIKKFSEIADLAEKLVEEQERIGRMLMELEEKKAALEQDITKQKIAYAGQKAEYNTWKEKLPFETSVQARKTLEQMKQTVEKTVRVYETAAGEVRKSLDVQKELEGRKTTLGEQLSGKEQADLEAIGEQKKEAMKQLEICNGQYMDAHNRNDRNLECREALKRLFAKDRDLQKQYEIISNLNKTANGNLSGSVKLDFETYIQRQYFKQIIRAANKRLIRMTGGEFILQCKDVEKLGSQGQAGLDLDVYHMATDTVRDVKTLSGGESFMASLAMALGLSDIVQHTAGAIHLDTMFVDEGFGSLDDTARDQAIRVLTDLADQNRLVGIISHVNELKEQIDRKLLVTKTENGSIVRWSDERGI